MNDRRREVIRILRFGAVGASGVVVNEAVFAGALALLGGASGPLALNLAAVAGFAVSVASNFTLNSLWTWGDRAHSGSSHAKLARATSYVAVALVALGVQLAILNALVGMGWLPILANFAGIGAGTVVNFAANHWWTFRDQATGWAAPWPPSEPARSAHALRWVGARARDHRWGPGGGAWAIAFIGVGLAASAALLWSGDALWRDTSPVWLERRVRNWTFWLNALQAFAFSFTVFEMLYRTGEQRLWLLLPLHPSAWYWRRVIQIAAVHTVLLAAVTAPLWSLVWLGHHALAVTALGSLALVWGVGIPVATSLHLLAGTTLLSGDSPAKQLLGQHIAPPAGAFLFYSPAIAFAGSMAMVLLAEVAFRLWLEAHAWLPLAVVSATALAAAAAALRHGARTFSSAFGAVLPRFWESEIVAPFREDHLPRRTFGLRWARLLREPAARALFRRDVVQMHRRYRGDFAFVALYAAGLLGAGLAGDGPPPFAGFALVGSAAIGAWFNPALRLVGAELENPWTLSALPLGTTHIWRAKGLVSITHQLYALLAGLLAWLLSGGGAGLAVLLAASWAVVAVATTSLALMWAHPARLGSAPLAQRLLRLASLGILAGALALWRAG